MTYDEAVNRIAECYTLGDFATWVMTDDDTAQMRRARVDGRFEFIEMWEEYEDGSAVLFHEIIDLSSYSDKELRYYGSMYYASQEEFKRQGAEIMAECVYEQNREVCFYGSPDEVYTKYMEILESEG